MQAQSEVLHILAANNAANQFCFESPDPAKAYSWILKDNRPPRLLTRGYFSAMERSVACEIIRAAHCLLHPIISPLAHFYSGCTSSALCQFKTYTERPAGHTDRLTAARSGLQCKREHRDSYPSMAVIPASQTHPIESLTPTHKRRCFPSEGN